MAPYADRQDRTGAIVAWGFVLAAAAILIPFTAIPALILGVIAVTRDRVGQGVAILLLALALGLAGASLAVDRLSDDGYTAPEYVAPTEDPACSGYALGTPSYLECIGS